MTRLAVPRASIPRPRVWWVAAVLCLIGCGSKPPDSPSDQTCTPVAGAVCFGRSNFIEYDGGDLPIVISVPHGGSLAPAGIPDRSGTTVTDSMTVELGRALVQAFMARTGRAPHLILSLLKRTKLDANREVGDAAQGNADAIRAWNDYHGFVAMASSEVVRRQGRGIYIDLHGHGHDIQRLELGYLLSASTLNRTDDQLNAGTFAAQSSIRLAMGFTPSSFAEVLRGPTSLGGLLAGRAASVPSPAMPAPGADPYFDGGFSTDRYASVLPSVQIECNFAGIRDSASSRAAFADALAAAVASFVSAHLGLSL